MTDNQKRFALKTAQDFKEAWERFENQKIVQDRDQRIRINATDKEWIVEHMEKLVDEEQKYIEDKIGDVEAELADDDHKKLMEAKFRLQFQAILLKERDDFKKRLD